LKTLLEGRSPLRTPFLFLIVNPSQNELSKAAARNPELLKQLLCNNFLSVR
jgi:hypothetical protein